MPLAADKTQERTEQKEDGADRVGKPQPVEIAVNVAG
jgi:hypothetical protein